MTVSSTRRNAARFVGWLERIDSNGHRRIKGLRLVTAYCIAGTVGALPVFVASVHDGYRVSSLAAGFALWASVSETRTSRAKSSRDLVALCLAAVIGAASFAIASPTFRLGLPGPEWILISGAFLAGYLRRFGALGCGIGSQLYIGQVLAYGLELNSGSLAAVCLAGGLAIVASVIPRVLTGPGELPAYVPPDRVAATPIRFRALSAETIMGLQAATASTIVITLNAVFGLTESVWAVTACVYVVAGTSTATFDRVRKRIAGTLIGVPIGLAMLPIAEQYRVLIWATAALAMVIYAMALPERYDVACGAFAFALIVTLVASGQHSMSFLWARAWETILGGLLGCVSAYWLFPLRTNAAQ